MRQWQEKKLENLVGGITDFVEDAKPTQLAEANNLITNKEGILIKRDGTKYNKRITETGLTAITNTWEMEGFLFVITQDNRCFYISTDRYDDPIIPWTELKGPAFTEYGLQTRNWNPTNDTVFGGNYGQMWLHWDGWDNVTSPNDMWRTKDVDGNLIEPWGTVPYLNVPMKDGQFMDLSIEGYNGVPSYMEPTDINGEPCFKVPSFPLATRLTVGPFWVESVVTFEDQPGPFPYQMPSYTDQDGLNSWPDLALKTVYEDSDGLHYIESQSGSGISMFSPPPVTLVRGTPDQDYLAVVGVIEATDPLATVINAKNNQSYYHFWDGGSQAAIGGVFDNRPINAYPLPTDKCVYTLLIFPDKMERYINGELVYSINATSSLPDWFEADTMFWGMDEIDYLQARDIKYYNMTFKEFNGDDDPNDNYLELKQIEKLLADEYLVTLPNSHPYAGQDIEDISGWPTTGSFYNSFNAWTSDDSGPEWSAFDFNFFLVTSIPNLEDAKRFLFFNGASEIEVRTTETWIENENGANVTQQRSIPIPEDTPFILCGKMRNGNSYQEFINGDSTPSVDITGFEKIGLTNDYANVMGYIPDQKFGEFFIWNGPLDDDTQYKIEGYLSSKWKIPLPVTHPYYDPALVYFEKRQENIRLPFSHPELIADWDVNISNGHTYIGGKTLNETTEGVPDTWIEDYTGLVLSKDQTYYKPNRALPKKIYISVDANGIKTPQLRTAVMPRIEKSSWGYQGINDVVQTIHNQTGNNDYVMYDENEYNNYQANMNKGIAGWEDNHLWRIELGFHYRYKALVGDVVKEYHEISDTILRWVYFSDVDEEAVPNNFSEDLAQEFGLIPISNFHGSNQVINFDDGPEWKYGAFGGKDGVYFDHGHWNIGNYQETDLGMIQSPDNNNGYVEYVDGQLDSGMMFYHTSDFAGRNTLSDESQQYLHPNSNNFLLSCVIPKDDGYSYFSWYPMAFTPIPDVGTGTAKNGLTGGMLGHWKNIIDSTPTWNLLHDNGNYGDTTPLDTFKPEDKLDYSLPWQDDNYAGVKPYIFGEKAKGAYWYVMEELGNNRLYQSYVGDAETFNLANYIEFNAEIKGLAEFNDKVIVFTKDDKIHRIEGLITAGQGYIDSVAIDGVFDLLTPTCIVRTPQGVFFPSLDGFCFTDGVRAMKITDHIPDTYKEFIATLGTISNGTKVGIVGSYNPVDEYILFERDMSQNMFVIDIKYGINNQMPVYLWQYNKIKFAANHSVYSNDLDKYITYMNGANKHFEKGSYDDQWKDTAASDATISRIIAKLKTPNIYFGSKLQRKIVGKIVPTFEKQGQDEYVEAPNNPITDWVGMFIQPKINVDGRDDENLQDIDHVKIIKDTVNRRRFGDRPSQALLSNILTVSRRVPSRNTRGMYYTFILDEADITPKKINGEEDTKSHFKLLNFSVLYAMLGDSANMTYTDAGSGDE